MVTKEYNCNNCGNDFEVRRSMLDDSRLDCPACGSVDTKRVFRQPVNFDSYFEGSYKADNPPTRTPDSF